MEPLRLERRVGKLQMTKNAKSGMSKTGTSTLESARNFFYDPVLKKKISHMRLKTRIDLVR